MSLIPDSVIALNERVSRLLYLENLRLDWIVQSNGLCNTQCTSELLHEIDPCFSDSAERRYVVVSLVFSVSVFFLQRLNVELNHPQTLSDLFSALSKPITF